MAVEIADITHVAIEYVSPHSLIPHVRNSKIYGDEDIASLKERIRASNWIKPLVVTQQNMIISGHRRWRTAIELGLLSVPVERRTFANEPEELEALLLENESRDKTPEQRVREADVWREIESCKAHQRMGEAKKASLQGKENFPYLETGQSRDKVAERVGFGTGRTYEKAAKVVEAADRLVGEGKKTEAQTLLETLNKKSVHKAYQQVKKQEQQEEVAKLHQVDLLPAPVEFVAPIHVEAGQVWQLGSHLLYCGDSSSLEYRRLSIPGKLIALAFADPPYNAGVAEWDNNFVWNHDYLSSLAPVVAVTPGIASIQKFMAKTTMPYRWSSAYWLDNGMTRGELGFGNWIYVALFANNSLYRNAQDFERVSISSSDRDELKHKGRKPLAMMLHLIKMFSKEDEVIIDPFLGTGSTLIVCEQTGRHCIGAEINPVYCESIIKRWENASGKKAQVL